MLLNKKNIYISACVVSLTLTSSAYATTGSTTPFANGAPPNLPITVDGGYINYPPTAGSEQQTFYTNRGCPANFAPFVELRVTKLKYAYPGADALSGFGACVNWVANSGFGNYEVFYLVSRKFNYYPNTGQQGYVGTNNGAWTIWSTYLVSNFVAWAGFYSDYQNIGGIYWRLWCYPSPTLTGYYPPEDQMFQFGNLPQSPYPNNYDASSGFYACVGGEGNNTTPY